MGCSQKSIIMRSMEKKMIQEFKEKIENDKKLLCEKTIEILKTKNKELICDSLNKILEFVFENYIEVKFDLSYDNFCIKFNPIFNTADITLFYNKIPIYDENMHKLSTFDDSSKIIKKLDDIANNNYNLAFSWNVDKEKQIVNFLNENLSNHKIHVGLNAPSRFVLDENIKFENGRWDYQTS